MEQGEGRTDFKNPGYEFPCVYWIKNGVMQTSLVTLNNKTEHN